MSFNPLPMTADQRNSQDLTHAYKMLGILGQRGNFDVQPLPQFNYDALTRKLQEQAAQNRAQGVNSILNNTSQAVQDAAQQAAANPQYNLGGGGGGLGNGPLADFLRSEIAQESGGNYGAVSSAGALGKYQIMPANIPSWSQQILGHAITPHYFLTHPHVQDVIGRGMLTRYYRKYGAAGAASAWFSGSPTAYKSNPQVAAYVRSVLRRMRGY